jgi:hypothetical protein
VRNLYFSKTVLLVVVKHDAGVVGIFTGRLKALRGT